MHIPELFSKNNYKMSQKYCIEKIKEEVQLLKTKLFDIDEEQHIVNSL